jgi:EgtB-related family protein
LPTEFEWECAALSQPAFTWGHAWEWTSSTFLAFPGFVPHPYREYSMPWFGTRRVLKGACPATSSALAHPRYRNFFEPARADIFAGFRTCA